MDNSGRKNRGGAETQRENQLAEKIIGCAIEVHRALGTGLLESAYEECFCYELAQKDGIKRLVNEFHGFSASPRLGGE